MRESTNAPGPAARTLTLPRLPIAAIALLIVVGCLAQGYAASHEIAWSRSPGLLWHFSLSYAVAWWVELDRKANRIDAPFEYSAAMFFLWPLLLPFYFYQTLRWRGVLLGIGFLLLGNVPDLVGILMYPW